MRKYEVVDYRINELKITKKEYEELIENRIRIGLVRDLLKNLDYVGLTDKEIARMLKIDLEEGE